MDGARYFIERVLPLVRQRIPDVRFLVAGTVCEELKVETDGVELLGVVERLEDAYARATVVVNPVLAGTGLKTKTVEALGHAKPLVTTSCGAEGIEEAAGSAYLIADGPASMAEEVAGLLESPARAAELAGRAFRFAAEWNEAQIGALRSLHEPPTACGQAALDARSGLVHVLSAR